MLSLKLSIGEKIVRFLYDGKFRHAVFVQNLLRDPRLSPHNAQSIRNALTKLSKEKLIFIGLNGIILQPNGRRYVEQKMARLRLFNSPFSKTSPKNLLVLFDIPEDRKAEREWFRKQLREFGYDMIQKSVWLGPSSLPKEFVQYVKNIGLDKCIKTFKLARTQQSSLKQ